MTKARVTLFTLLALLLSATTARAQFFSPDDCIPSPFSAYRSPQELHAEYGPSIRARDILHADFLDCDPAPIVVGDTTFHMFGSTVSGLISLDGGATYSPFEAPALANVSVTLTSIVGNTRNFTTEMLQLDISGGTLPAGVLFCESPTLASPGVTTITGTGGLLAPPFLINSVFTIFTELSLNGGTTWTPANGGVPVIAVSIIPEPGSIALFGAGGLALLGSIRRRRRATFPD